MELVGHEPNVVPRTLHYGGSTENTYSGDAYSIGEPFANDFITLQSSGKMEKSDGM